MNSALPFMVFIPLVSFILIAINLIFALHLPYKEKKTPFECGYHSFLLQNRTQFTISFFTFGLLFLVFDLEIVLIYPVAVSVYANAVYGLTTAVLFIIVVTLGFLYELGKDALKIDSKQSNAEAEVDTDKKRVIPAPFGNLTNK